MADPITLISLAATIGSGALSAAGAAKSGEAQSQSYKYQSGIAKLNQQLAANNAQYAMQVGDQQNQRFGLGAAAQMGQIKAAQGSSGLDLNSGSAAQVRASQTSLNRLDSSVIRQNAARTAYNYEMQGATDQAQSIMDTSAASNSLTAGYLGAGASVLGSASSVSNIWLRGQMVGMWNQP